MDKDIIKQINYKGIFVINLSALFSYEAIPLIQAVQEHPAVHFEWLPLSILQEQFIQRKVDGILCPPLMVARFPGSLVVPGIGIASSKNIPSPVLYSSKHCEEIKTVAVNNKFEFWKNWLKLVLQLLSPNTIDLRVNEKDEEYKDAYLTDIIETKQKEKYVYEYNLGELWKKVSPYPMVCWVWLCRGDSDYKQIRSVLGYTWEKAKENLSRFQERLFDDIEEPLKEKIKQINGLGDIYYNLASLEFEGFYWLVEQAKNLGIVSKNFEAHLC